MNIAGLFNWLFTTREGVIALVLGGILLFLVIAVVLERRTRASYDQYDEESDDEDGWSVFDDDNN